jgi:hydrogenase-4 transcriptional activator
MIEHSSAADPFGDVLLAVWREACRHIDIEEAVGTIARLLAVQLPLAQVVVRRLDVARSAVETIAVGLPESRALDKRCECSTGQWRDLAAWAGRGQIARRRDDLDALPWSVVVPGGLRGDVLAGPLGSAAEPSAVLLLAAQEQAEFDERHLAVMRALLEPFTAAVENDRRLREMTAMKAAAEADKNSLLMRLGRKELADTVVGAETGLKSVLERVALVARSDAPVLLLGETGTGKELIARVIHTQSARAAGPFLRVNCGAIPSELIDSQLFGHERGAFTGAVEMRQGWFERADGGTLLLDEIGELPPAAQVRLLRILQDGWLERVGSQQSVHVNVRILAATHRDLAGMVAEGTFREDLWYRIAVFPVWLPPLRERREDIPALAQHFAERAARRFLLPVALPTPADIQCLAAYDWPGNIRELGAVIDRAAILGDGKRLEVVQALGTPVRPAAAVEPARLETPRTAGEVLSLDAAMRHHIESVLQLTAGRIEGPRGVAALLQINPHTLRARMRKLGIDWAKFRHAE